MIHDQYMSRSNFALHLLYEGRRINIGESKSLVVCSEDRLLTAAAIPGAIA